MTSFAGTALQRGTVLAGYRIEALLGRGGMGVVYLAEQVRLKRRVALKLLAPELAADERFRERFLRESELAASLDHPNVVPIYDAGEAEGLLYIAMRYVEGTDLATLLAREGRLEPQRAVAIVGAVAAGLDAAHVRGLVHRDVKPANVLLARDGHVYLADFGLTRSAQEGGPEEKPHLSGTLEYVAPEQIDGEPPEPAADIYALGCVLYHCVAGQPPFPKDSPMALLWAHFHEQPPSLHERRPELSQAIDPVIAKVLAKEPEERYASGSELTGAAAEALGVGVPRSPMSRRRLLLIAAAVALAVAIAAAVPSILLGRGNNNPAKPTTVITRDTLQRIDPDTNKLVASIPYGQASVPANFKGSFGAGPVAAGEGGVWVFGPRAQTVLRIDPETNSVTGQSAVSLEPDADVDWETVALTAEFGRVWAVTNTAAVTVVDPQTTVTADPIPIPGVNACFHLTPALGSVFVWCENGNGADRPASAWRIDPATGTPVRVLEYGDGPFDVTAQPGDPSDERVWFAQGSTKPGGYVLAVYDLATARLLAEFQLPFDIAGFEARESPAGEPDGNTSAWVSNASGDTVWQLDPFTGEVAAKIPVGDAPTGIALSDGAVWVVNSGDGTVSRIDPGESRVVNTIEVGGNPQSIAVGEGGVWVTVYPPVRNAPTQEAARVTQRSATPIGLTTALTFDPGGPDCPQERPCADHGTFTAANESTAALLCPTGTMSELFYFPDGGEAFTIADRALTCPDGSTLVMHVERIDYEDLTATTAAIGETWTVTRGTGRFGSLKGDGTMNETFDTGVTPNTLGGKLAGDLG